MSTVFSIFISIFVCIIIFFVISTSISISIFYSVQRTVVTLYDLRHKLVLMSTVLPIGDTVVRTLQDGVMVYVLTSAGTFHAVFLFKFLAMFDIFDVFDMFVQLFTFKFFIRLFFFIYLFYLYFCFSIQ